MSSAVLCPGHISRAGKAPLSPTETLFALALAARSSSKGRTLCQMLANDVLVAVGQGTPEPKRRRRIDVRQPGGEPCGTDGEVARGVELGRGRPPR